LTSLRKFHWLWAYVVQFDWQHRSGRLSLLVTAKEPTQDTSTKTTPHPDCIDVNSWWGYMNFSFSVAILLALEKIGWLSETLGGEKKTPVLIQLDPVSQELVDNDVCVQKCIAAWENMFRHAYAGYRSIILGNREHSQKEYINARFHLQKEVWKAHTAVIDGCDGGERYEALVSQMPMPEELFARGWARMVSILAAACFPTDLITLKKDGAGFLPLQIISNSMWQEWQDQAKQLTGVPKRHYSMVKRTHDLVKMKESELQSAVAFWTRVVRSEDTSRSMPRIVTELFHGSPLAKARQLARVSFLFVQPREWIAIVAAVAGIIAYRIGSSAASRSPASH